MLWSSIDQVDLLENCRHMETGNCRHSGDPGQVLGVSVLAVVDPEQIYFELFENRSSSQYI